MRKKRNGDGPRTYEEAQLQRLRAALVRAAEEAVEDGIVPGLPASPDEVADGMMRRWRTFHRRSWPRTFEGRVSDLSNGLHDRWPGGWPKLEEDWPKWSSAPQKLARLFATILKGAER